MNSYKSAISSIAKKIFKAGSTTYYYSSLFFPRDAREDISTLYAYVRTADDFVDATPQDISGFNTFCKKTDSIFAGKQVDHPIIQAFHEMAVRNSIPYEYVLSFLEAMRADTQKTTYNTFAELETYMYGSAEVIGLMMCKILKLPEASYAAAQKQGKAMQLINFIRDIQEDITLGRQYIPTEDMRKFGLSSLSPKTEQEFTAFKKLVSFEIEKYLIIQKEAEKGYRYIPKRYLVPIQTAAAMYNWTAQQIQKNPLLVFQKKVKPTPAQIIVSVLARYITL